MKRRDFILGSLSATGVLLPLSARGQSLPCPPPAFQVDNTQAATECVVSDGSVPTWWSDDVAHPVATWRSYAAGGLGGSLSASQRGRTIVDAASAAGIPVTTGVLGYSGACIDQAGRRMLLMGGGHGDYSGNEVYALNLNQSVPAWEVFKGRSPGQGTSYVEGYNGSGQHPGDIGVNQHPVTSHTSTVLQIANGKLWIGQMWSTPNPANNGTSARFSLDLNTKVWTSYGKTLTSAEAALLFNIDWEGPGVAVLEERNEYWGSFFSNSGDANSVRIYVMDTITGAIKTKILRGSGAPVQVGTTRAFGKASVCAVPTKGARPPFFIANTIGDGVLAAGLALVDPDNPHLVYNLNLNNTSGITPTWTGGNNCTNTSLQYHASADAIYIACPHSTGGVCGRFVKLQIPAGMTLAALASATWNVTLVQPSNWNTVPLSQDGRIYGRFSLVRDMGDGRGAIVVLPTADGEGGVRGPAYVLKLPRSGL